MRLLASLTVASGLFAGTAQGAMLIDFGTDPGQGNTTSGLEVWTGYGALPVTRAFTADTLNLTYSPAGTWTNRGEQYGGAYIRGINLSNVVLTDKMAMEARFILGSPHPDFYKFTVALYAANGHSSTYMFIGAVETNPAPFSYGTDPLTTPFTVAQATTDMGHPTSVANGGFLFGTDALSEVDILYQVGGTATGSFTAQIDNIQIPVPEPATLGLAIPASLLVLRRRRA